MPNGPIIDSDILLKVSAYRIADECLDALHRFGEPGALGLSHIIAHGQLSKCKKRHRLIDLEAASDELSKFLEALCKYEPTEPEIEIAAQLERASTDAGLFLDSGEAQLVALVLGRDLPFLLTGDKRAIKSLEAVLSRIGRSGEAANKVLCLEQVIKALVAKSGMASIRGRICAEPDIDSTLKICFGCGSEAAENAALEGLESYIRYERENAFGVLLADLN